MGRVGGAAVFLVALVGVCGPKRESKCLLRTHSIVLGDAWLGCSSARPTTRAQMRAIASWEIAACRRADLHAQVSSQGSASASPSTMTRGSSYVAQTDVYVHAEERVVTRNDGNLTRAHEAGEGIAICCMASQGHIVGGVPARHPGRPNPHGRSAGIGVPRMHQPYVLLPLRVRPARGHC